MRNCFETNNVGTATRLMTIPMIVIISPYESRQVSLHVTDIHRVHTSSDYRIRNLPGAVIVLVRDQSEQGARCTFDIFLAVVPDELGWAGTDKVQEYFMKMAAVRKSALYGRFRDRSAVHHTSDGKNDLMQQNILMQRNAGSRSENRPQPAF